MEGDCTTSPGSKSHCLTDLTVKNALQTQTSLTSSHAWSLLPSHHAALWRTWLCSPENLPIGAGRAPQTFSSPGSTTGTVPLPLLTRQKLTPRDNLGSSPLHSFHFINNSLVLGAARLDAVLWMWSNECRVEGDNRFTRPASCAPADTGHMACCPPPPRPSQQSCSPPRPACCKGLLLSADKARKPSPLNSCL